MNEIAGKIQDSELEVMRVLWEAGEALLITVLSLSLSGSILALVLFVGKPLVKNKVSEAFGYYIWLLVLLLLALPVAAPVNIMDSLFRMEQSNMLHEFSDSAGNQTETENNQFSRQTAALQPTQPDLPEPQNDSTDEPNVPAKAQRASTLWGHIKVMAVAGGYRCQCRMVYRRIHSFLPAHTALINNSS